MVDKDKCVEALPAGYVLYANYFSALPGGFGIGLGGLSPRT